MKWLKANVLMLFGMALICLSGQWNIISAQTIVYSDERLSVHADNEPLIPVLEKIAREANILVFISRDFTPGMLKIKLDAQPLEKALDRILKGLNVVKVYHESSGKPRLTAVKIYPKGKFSGPLDVVIQATVPEPGVAFSGTGKYPSLRTDVLQPQGYVQTVEYDALVPSAMEFERREADAWQEIQTLKNQMNDEVDETKNEVLSLALLDKYEAFEKMQTSHINTLEKMHRMEHFMESRANKEDKQK